MKNSWFLFDLLVAWVFSGLAFASLKLGEIPPAVTLGFLALVSMYRFFTAEHRP